MTEMHPLIFEVVPDEGEPYTVDLTEFERGGRIDLLDARSRNVWAGDFEGRPLFARDIALYFKIQRPNKADERSVRSGFRTALRFLDHVDPLGAIDECSKIDDAHGPLMQDWVSGRGNGDNVYKYVKGLIYRVREYRGCHKLFWPAARRKEPATLEDIDETGVRRLYSALKKEAMSIKANFREGDSLAAQGRDPRGYQSVPDSARWDEKENHAWLIRHLTRDVLIDKAAFYAEGARGLNKANTATQKFDGPSYLVPGMSSRGREGIVGKLRWFHPSYHDTAVFLWLFMLGTGWNLETALNVDVFENEDGTINWYEDHPQKPEFKVIHAFKGRSDRHVFCLSMVKPEWHPFKILQYMIERTKPLRRTLEAELAIAVKQHARHPSTENKARIARLSKSVRSPWIYHVVNKVGSVGCLNGRDSGHLNDMVRNVIVANNLLEKHPSLSSMTTSDARDAWIGYAYVASGYNVLIARLAAQHKDNNSLKHYIRRRRYRLNSEKTARKLHSFVFSELESGHVLDATRLRVLMEKGHITPEQERRLADKRMRTRLGMGCLDAHNPPWEVAPDHKLGNLCRIQRCTGCIHGLIFEDSLPPLCRALAELFLLKGRMSLSAWKGSSFEDEEISIVNTLKAFDAQVVESEIDHWLSILKNDETYLHDTYPQY